MKANAQKGRKHPFKFILIVCSAIFSIWLAFSTLKTSSFAKSFRGGFIAAASDFSQAYTYTSGSNTYYLLFASNVNVVCLTSSKSGNAGLTTYQEQVLPTVSILSFTTRVEPVIEISSIRISQMIPFYLSLKLLVAAYLKFINSKRQI